MHSISSPTAKYTRTQLSAGPRVPSGGVTRQGVVPSPTVSPFLIADKPPPLLLLLLCSRALHLHEASMRLVADEIVFNHAVEQRASIIQDRDQGPCSSPPPLHLNIPSVQHVLYRDTLCAEQTHSSLHCSAWYLSVVPA